MKLSGDRGSVTLLVIAFMGVCLTCLGVITDAAAAYLEHRTLTSMSEGAALHASARIDEHAYYSDGGRVVVTEGSARTAVNQYLDTLKARDNIHGLTVESVQVIPSHGQQGPQIVVKLRAPLNVPILGSWVEASVVSGEATAYLKVG